MSRRIQFETIRSEGALLPADLLQRVTERDKELGGLRGEDYGLPPNEPLSEAIVRSYNRMIGAWGSFREARARLPEGDPGTSVTRDRLLLVLLQELGYGRVQIEHAIEIDGRSYAISHAWAKVPIHLLGCNVPLGVRSKGVAGASSQSPHGTLQELLNRSDERLWGIVSNGLELRLLRDNSSLTRQAFVSFDLEQMFEGDVYSDFTLLWMLCHASRVEGERPHECWLERWSQEAQRQGTRALEGLRTGVEGAISALGSGFLRPGRNAELKAALRAGELSARDYYRELLRLVYRLLFLFVAEDRRLLHHPGASEQAKERYAEWYSSARLRRLGERRRGTKHSDLWEGLGLVMRALGTDDGEPELGLPALGSFLWSEEAIPHLEGASLPNGALLEAVRSLATVTDGKALRSVDYRNLGAEELGSVYESLLELHPELDLDAGAFSLTTTAGNERRTTGSYYTPSSLISCLLDSALDPVLDEAAANGEQAILDLRVVDPACGSGHFLVAAAHRIAKRLASVRTGDEEPSPEATRSALRDVVSLCLYGVDMNPMAVELCKVSLWMEALDPGRPLSFLDAHIKCGNSLLGTTVELIDEGIPDDAFKPIEGDDKEVAKSLRKQNKTEREGQLTLEDLAEALVDELEAEAAAIEATADDSLRAVQEKERRFVALSTSEAYERAKLTADAWCAAFVQRMVGDAPRITTGVVWRVASANEGQGAVREEVRRLAGQYGFFQWEIEFPQVFGRGDGGFDLVIGNPPWERVKLQEKEFFAAHPAIAGARNAAERRRRIAALETEDPPLFAEYQDALRKADGDSHLVRTSGRYPLCGRGDVNTYSIFAELMRSLLSPAGRVGCVLPLGIATDDTTKHFFGDLVKSRSIASLYGFENEEFVFPAIHHATKFCLLTMSGAERPSDEAEFAFFCRQVSALTEPNRCFTLAPDDFALLNPNTRTCPVFRTRRDAELTKAIYQRVPVLVDESRGEDGNAWGVSFMTMFHMANDSQLFRTRDELQAASFVLDGNIFLNGSRRFLPLYEGKMIHQFDHRFGTYEGQTEAQANQGKLPELTDDMHDDPFLLPLPRYWVEEKAVIAAAAEVPWFIGFRDMTSSVVLRTVIASFVPRTAVNHKLPLVTVAGGPEASIALLAVLDSFVLDYIARQKLGGTSLTFFVVKQFPVLSPAALRAAAPWDETRPLSRWLQDRVVELICTAVDAEPVARDLGLDIGCFKWDRDRRAMLGAELDAAFFHLYGLAEEDVDYVLETFPIVKRRDEEAFGHYRTKALILDVYRKLADAIATGAPYETTLDPPPADARVAHPPSLQRPATPKVVEST